MTTSWIRTSTIACLLGAGSTVAFAQTAQTAQGPQAPQGTQGTQGSARTRPRLSGFSVALVEGDLRGANAQEGLSPAAAKALADLKDFLPYKSYRLLDMQWTLGGGTMASRLRGANGQEYDLVFETQNASPVVAVSKFQLSEVGTTAALDPKSSRSAYAAATPAELSQLLQAANARRSLIDTSFRMDVGETVVVGTSRLQGDKALIVLLTAVGGRPGAAGAATGPNSR